MDTHERLVCGNCQTILYENPKIIAGVIPIFKNKVLLCQRNIEPKKSFWTVPSGFMEMNETLKEAALRESKEEAGIEPIIDHLHTVYDLTHVGQVYFLFLAHCQTDQHQPGIETMQSKWVKIPHINWDEIAFSAVAFALQRLDTRGPHFFA